MKKFMILSMLLCMLFVGNSKASGVIYNTDILFSIAGGLFIMAAWSAYKYSYNKSIYIPITGFSFGVAGVSFLCAGIYYH